MRRSIIAVVALTVAGLIPAPSRAATAVVFMANFRFCSTPVCADNQPVTVARGDTVLFVFADPACIALHAVGCYHTATSTSIPVGGAAFNSGPMPGPAGTFGGTNPKLTFEKVFSATAARGTYNYVCVIHTASAFPLGPMRAQIIVT